MNIAIKKRPARGRRRVRETGGMKVLGNRVSAVGFIGLADRAGLAGPRRSGHWHRQSQRLLRRQSQACPACRGLQGSNHFPVHQGRPCRTVAQSSACFAEHRARARDQYGGTGGRSATHSKNPHSYVDFEPGRPFLHILEGCRHHGVEHLVYAFLEFGFTEPTQGCRLASMIMSIIR